MNWGYKILFVYLAFVAGILLLVFKVSGEKDDLVTEDYYAQELKYQERIDAKSHADKLSSLVQFELKDGQLTINFPKDFSGKKIDGNVLLYCPADKNKDIRQDFSIKDTLLAIAIPRVCKGLYELHIKWNAEGVGYYYEKKINI